MDRAYATTSTELTAHLIISGFPLLEILYEPRGNGKQRGIFIFERTEALDDLLGLYHSKQIAVNMADYKAVHGKVLDYVLNGLPWE